MLRKIIKSRITRRREKKREKKEKEKKGRRWGAKINYLPVW